MLKENIKKTVLSFLYENDFHGYGDIPIDISFHNYKEALALRKKFSLFNKIGVATFLSKTILWRVIDEFEFSHIIKTREVKGGNFSVPPERYFGASFTASRSEAIEFGIKWKKAQRLKGQLYIIGINAEDKEFLHLMMVDELMKQGYEYNIGSYTVNSKIGNTGLGFSVANVKMEDIIFIYKLDDLTGNLNDITFDIK